MKKILPLALLIILLSSCATDRDDNLDSNQIFSEINSIETDSELYNQLKQIATDDDERPDLNISCLNFNYPLTIFVFDDLNQFDSVNFVTDDDSFRLLLDNIDSDFSISVSFPITSTLETGEEFIIETKEDLKNAINNCLDEELIFECNQLLENCNWKVGYSFNYDNDYLGGIFQESDGFTIFSYDSSNYAGSWTTFLIENQLHINTNLINGSQEIVDFFNFDWKVEYIDGNSLSLKNGEREIILNQRCDDDYDECNNFNFEVCENEADTGISDFILDDYKFCIFDTLELDEDLNISFFETEEDLENNENPIQSDQIYNNTENNQSIYVKINDQITSSEYIVEIILVSIGC